MSNHSVAAMTGLKAPKRRSKGGVTQHLAAANQHLAAVNDALHAPVKVSTLDLANALAAMGGKGQPAKAASPVKSKPSAKPQGAISAKGWHPAKVTDAPDAFQGKGGTVK